jgi:hypothetical protein
MSHTNLMKNLKKKIWTKIDERMRGDGGINFAICSSGSKMTKILKMIRRKKNEK